METRIPTNLKCHACGLNHPLSHCPTTTPSDRKRICEQKREECLQRKRDKQSSAHNAESKETKPCIKQGHANAVSTRRTAFSNVAVEHNETQHANKEPPTHVNGLPITIFNKGVVLDSGASDHMTHEEANGDIPVAAENPMARQRPIARVTAELMHHRMGHHDSRC